MVWQRCATLVMGVLLLACGGKVVLEEDAASSGGGAGGAESSSVSSVTSSIGGGGEGGTGGRKCGGPSLIETVETIDLGTFEASSSSLAQVSFTIEPTTTSFSLSIESSYPGSLVVLYSLAGPSGMLTQLGPTFEPIGPFKPKPYGFPSLPYALLYPNTPSLSVEPGNYTAQLIAMTENGPVPSELSITLYVKKATTPATEGSFELDIWISENQLGFNAAAAENEPLMDQALEALCNVYQNAGIAISDIVFRDVMGFPQLSVIDDYVELAELLALPDVERNGRMAAFLVEQIDLTTEGVILGVAPGVPGPAVVPFGPHNGVAVSLLTLDAGGPSQLGETLAHEIGHYLGLEHTTSYDGSSHDPIDDTPECTKLTGGYVMPESCVDDGAYNFMFWTNFQSPTSQSQVSPGQRMVMNGNPSVATGDH